MKVSSLIFIVVATGLVARGAAAQDRDEADETPIYAPINEPFNATSRPVEDRTIARRVGDELERPLGDASDDIRVHVRDGRVYLSGYVRDERTRRLVHDAVWTVAGVRELRIDRLYASSYFKPDRY